MKLHCIVEDVDTARTAVEGGATVVQLRLKDAPTLAVVEAGRPILQLCREANVTFIVNDDVEAALALNADGVHLGRSDEGKELARAAGLMLGISAASVYEAIAAQQQADYIGAGPVWDSPSKTDAPPAIGLDGLAAICEAVKVPVIAIGGVDPSNARECIVAGAKGVAVLRASNDARAVLAAVGAASF
ncbi:MAG: thiamine-phosphate pyrophosphorylase [Gaiellaceae bacterium]|nr:thiamine-phosphate pyrophosphorylase [Gaiellaceae bacterium]